MIAAVAGVLYFLGIKDQPGAFWGFFAMFMILFFATGVGNASTFQMIPAIMRTEMPRLEPGMAPPARQKQAEMESAAIIGFTSAVAAYGAFFIPKAYGTSIALTGGPRRRCGASWRSTSLASRSPGSSTPAAAACCTTSNAAGRCRQPPRNRPNEGN